MQFSAQFLHNVSHYKNLDAADIYINPGKHSIWKIDFITHIFIVEIYGNLLQIYFPTLKNLNFFQFDPTFSIFQKILMNFPTTELFKQQFFY